jgi:hypothetical protein
MVCFSAILTRHSGVGGKVILKYEMAVTLAANSKVGVRGHAVKRIS